MRRGHHLYLFYLGTTFWTLFFLGGLPSQYYQTWPWALSLIVVVILPSWTFVVLVRQLRRTLLSVVAPRRAALWLAFYMTAPLLAYDLIYLGWHLGLGAGFLQSHWYLTAFYVLPWMLALAATTPPRSGSGADDVR